MRPSSSLDRRCNKGRSRKERDHKSRSAYSLQNSSATSTADYASPEQTSGMFAIRIVTRLALYDFICEEITSYWNPIVSEEQFLRDTDQRMNILDDKEIALCHGWVSLNSIIVFFVRSFSLWFDRVSIVKSNHFN